MNNPLYPMKLARTLRPRIWGGPRLQEYLGLSGASEFNVHGESWEMFEENKIINGFWAGQSLRTVSEELGSDFLGSISYNRFGKKVPLLTKFIYARQPLSIQVHPGDDYVKANELQQDGFGKEEAWLIIEAQPGAKIIRGFENGTELSDIKRHIEGGTLESICEQVEVSAGDVILNPPGVVHAIGAGILLFEIQQASDLTFRLYDYKRRDKNGNLRPLHVEQGLRVIDLEPTLGSKVITKAREDGWVELVRTKNFVLTSKELCDGKNTYVHKSQKSFEIVTVIDGKSQLRSSGSEVTSLSQGESAILPAKFGDYHLQGLGKILRAGLEI